MTPSQIVIDVPMAGSVISVIQRALAITTLIQNLEWLSEQSMLIEMSIRAASPTSCPILQIKFVSLQSLERSASLMSYSMAESHHLAWAGAGENIREAIRTTIRVFLPELNQAFFDCFIIFQIKHIVHSPLLLIVQQWQGNQLHQSRCRSFVNPRCFAQS